MKRNNIFKFMRGFIVKDNPFIFQSKSLFKENVDHFIQCFRVYYKDNSIKEILQEERNWIDDPANYIFLFASKSTSYEIASHINYRANKFIETYLDLK